MAHHPPPEIMASVSEADARDAELAALSGEKLVDLLRTTYRRTDFEAVARVLKARDRRFAEARAALSDIDALRKKHYALLDARRRPRDEAEGMAPLLGISSRGPVHRDEPRVEELEDVPLSRRLKRPRQCETSPLESRKRDVQGQSNSIRTLGNYRQKSSSAKSVRSVGPIERIEQLVGSGMPKDSKQGSGVAEPGNRGGVDRSVLPKSSSQSDHGRGRIGKKQSFYDGILGPPPKGIGKTIKQSSYDGILGPPPKGIGKTINKSIVESSSRSVNKDTGTATKKCPSQCRQTEDWMIAKGGNPIQETRMVPSPSLSIGTLSGSELRAYCLKPERTPPASCMKISTQNFRDLAKGGNGLSKKPVDVKLVGGD